MRTRPERKAVTMAEPVSESRRINAPASAVFRILADPALHPGIDGLRHAAGGRRPGAASARSVDTFRMRMRNDEMGDYVMVNYVVEYEQVRRIGWEPEMHEASRPEDAPESASVPATCGPTSSRRTARQRS